jgi:isoquinoline 1-oxidoreductase alpha subunit
MATQLIVNGKSLSTTDDPRTPLLWVLRDTFGLTGTKFGCGIDQCGACTVMVDGEAVRSCVTPVARVARKRITTVEGLSTDNSHPVQKAWAAEQVAQCGYCQPGQMMSATALLAVNWNPSDARFLPFMPLLETPEMTAASLPLRIHSRCCLRLYTGGSTIPFPNSSSNNRSRCHDGAIHFLSVRPERAIERSGGGRGFVLTGSDFHANMALESHRRLLANAIPVGG